jgi:phosphoribosyl 1,2-cyclic phosphodiesterase
MMTRLTLTAGTSGQVPALGCLLHRSKPSRSPCIACFDATRLESKNRRGCTSAAVIGKGNDEEDSLIIIDCGPSFYNSILRHFSAQKLGRIDAILLTHAHADAILGLDSLRSWTMGGVIQDRVDVYLTQECFTTVESMFPYLVDQSRSTGEYPDLLCGSRATNSGLFDRRRRSG